MSMSSARPNFTFVWLLIGVPGWRHFFTPHSGTTTGCCCNSVSAWLISCTEIRNYDDYDCAWSNVQAHILSPQSRTVATTSILSDILLLYESNLQRSLLNSKTGLTQRLVVCILHNRDASPFITFVIYFTADQRGANYLSWPASLSPGLWAMHRYRYKIVNIQFMYLIP
jgi:hypothetical protein